MLLEQVCLSLDHIESGNFMAQKNKNEVWLTPKDIEERLHLSHGTVNKLIHTTGFPMIQIGRTIRIREDDFNEFIETYMNHKYNI